MIVLRAYGRRNGGLHYHLAERHPAYAMQCRKS